MTDNQIKRLVERYWRAIETAHRKGLFIHDIVRSMIFPDEAAAMWVIYLRNIYIEMELKPSGILRSEENVMVMC